MIDMENEIFNEVSAQVREQYPDIFMTGEYVKTPPSSPVFLSWRWTTLPSATHRPQRARKIMWRSCMS